MPKAKKNTACQNCYTRRERCSREPGETRCNRCKQRGVKCEQRLLKKTQLNQNKTKSEPSRDWSIVADAFEQLLNENSTVQEIAKASETFINNSSPVVSGIFMKVLTMRAYAHNMLGALHAASSLAIKSRFDPERIRMQLQQPVLPTIPENHVKKIFHKYSKEWFYSCPDATFSAVTLLGKRKITFNKAYEDNFDTTQIENCKVSPTLVGWRFAITDPTIQKLIRNRIVETLCTLQQENSMLGHECFEYYYDSEKYFPAGIPIVDKFGYPRVAHLVFKCVLFLPGEIIITTLQYKGIFSSPGSDQDNELEICDFLNSIFESKT